MSRRLEPLCRGSGRPHYLARLNTAAGFLPWRAADSHPAHKQVSAAQEPDYMFDGAFKRVIVALKSHSCHIQDTDWRRFFVRARLPHEVGSEVHLLIFKLSYS